MTEEAVDLRSMWAVLRRRTAVLLVAALLGAAAGVGLLVLVPPAFTSTSVVLLPAVSQSGSGRMGGYDAETQVLIVTSSEVLSRAARTVKPSLPVSEVADRVSVDAPASAVLRITAAGTTGARAEALASAVAGALVAYLEETRGTLLAAQRGQLQERLDTLVASLDAVTAEITATTARIARNGSTTTAGLADAAAVADLTAVRASTVLDVEALRKQLAGEGDTEASVPAGATVIQAASPGTQSGFVTDVLLHVLGGAALLLVLTASVVITANRRDPKLRSRDEIADSVGIPVVASLRVRPPRTAGAWVDLLRTYDPDSADGWGLRRLLHGLVPDAGKERVSSGPFVLVILSMSGDPAGLAVAPQVASFAASTGVTTQLHPAQQPGSAATLWLACAQASKQGNLRPALTVAGGADAEGADAEGAAELVVRLVVLDRDAPLPDSASVAGHAVLLAVSSASATRRNLADVVVAVDRVGREVEGIVVANPDPLDRTMGRLAAPESTGSPALPTRITSRAAGGAGPARAPRLGDLEGRHR
ncbi:Wzz/FepE/Etk N-terminal domain-containing protein [Knoellia aerolata]|uniref:Polysaccharide chain length determinant N-terminal domain-containing protein n=1 Tax=Knoellia aerolata DSM 18566 TaxID=1385519 RepID=A0A0A0JU14_9MICO|nr:Wzz/FepE/Etk N-terminal domain-containing protein [Knoellia aerolata]KGN40633.1 hypothetical protein N801_12895 [Knoellia aerolata DSM 18566]